MSTPINHALVLNLHQPSGNLEELFHSNAMIGKEILWAIDRIPRALWSPYEFIGRVHLSLSGTLLETLENQKFQSQVYGIAKCGDLLWYLQNYRIIDIVGTAYYHPILPLIPEDDREEHLIRWIKKGSHLFWRQFSGKGFWPPELGFCEEMIPMLVKLGYRYVLVDDWQIDAPEEIMGKKIRYYPHYASFGKEKIIVVVRDSILSNLLKEGKLWNLDHFIYELNHRTEHCEQEPLVTTCFDGDHGEWFRNSNERGNFWSVLYQPFLNKVLAQQCNIKPTFIDEYLNKHPPLDSDIIKIKKGAWNAGKGADGFAPWNQYPKQKDAFEKIEKVSSRLHLYQKRVKSATKNIYELQYNLNEAYWRLLRSETSCNFFWNGERIDKCFKDLNDANDWLGKVKELL
jgi:4-alpha-glucanotransferase